MYSIDKMQKECGVFSRHWIAEDELYLRDLNVQLQQKPG